MSKISFRSLSMYPTKSELFETSSMFSLKKNRTIGAFGSVDEYLDIHFKLLREDFIALLRENLENYRKGRKYANLNVYKKVGVFPKERFFRLDSSVDTRNFKKTKKLQHGALLIFTADNLKTHFLAKVMDEKNLKKKEFNMEFISTSFSGNNFTMIEFQNFFETYQVMAVLQKMDKSVFPMEKYIIKVNTRKCLPNYLENSELYTVDCFQFPTNDWSQFPDEVSGLNDSQVKALKASLSEEFVVIQGPPGTGKMYLGLKIIQILLQNCHLWYKNSPILVLFHKNRSLDYFLEKILTFSQEIVQVGYQSKRESLKNYNLNNLRKKKKSTMIVLREALVVGMTTMTAVRMKQTLKWLKSPIVIVEEAAEVLEAHIVASLTADCQHLILLGDHFQLKPITADQTIGQRYKLGVSLFERMVNNRIGYYRLTIQYRLRPEISKILKQTTYPFLEDHASVYNKPKILGVEKNFSFIDHHCPEENANVTSKKNVHEAKFVVAFAKYLIQNGYDSSDVTIIATYAGQVSEIINQIELLKCRAWLAKVAVSTLDAFKGQESEIIILSLVRSEKIGFIEDKTRIRLLLSKAKNGFYMIGNMGLLSSKSQLWHVIKLCLEKDDAIGSQLALRCQKHPHIITKVTFAEDFRKVPCGGCNMKCVGGKLPCGHTCPLSCHVLDHEKYIFHCKRLCERNICDIHFGNCSKLCFETCDRCEVKVLKKFDCGHSFTTDCSNTDCTICL